MKVSFPFKGLLLSLAPLLKRAGKMIVTAWLVIGATLLLIIALNLVCSYGSKLFSEHNDPNYFRKVENYKNAPWIDEYFKEFMGAYNTGWKSYVYFRWRPYKGKYLNIDERGLRFTVPSDLKDSEASKKINIFMFGGSTLWGWGVRDRYTIPSQLVEALSNQKVKAKITNFSGPGYVSTQELIDLIMQLQRGNVPDLVIFYDGVNDVYAAYQSGVAGIPQNEWKRELEYNISNRYRHLRNLFLLNSLDEYCLGRKIKEWANKLQPNLKKTNIIEGLENDIIKIYLNNVKAIEAISKSYCFQSMYYWQPVIYYKKHLSQYEEDIDRDKPLKMINLKTYSIIRKKYPELSKYHFYDISDIFADHQGPLYIDYCHIDEEGNKEIAQRMAVDVLKLIKPNN